MGNWGISSSRARWKHRLVGFFHAWGSLGPGRLSWLVRVPFLFFSVSFCIGRIEWNLLQVNLSDFRAGLTSSSKQFNFKVSSVSDFRAGLTSSNSTVLSQYQGCLVGL